MTVHQTISPEHIEPLGKALGDLFDFHELGVIVHKCAGEPEMNGISAENLPRWDIARKTLIWAEQYGYTKSFLSHTVAARPNNAELRELIAKAFPQALEVAPETRAQVETVVSALRNAQSELDAPGVKRAIASSTAKLEQIVTSLRLLETYKNLHDSLHNIQLTPFSYLRLAVRGMAESAVNVQMLRMYHDQVRTAHTVASSWVERLQDGVLSREAEEHWIQNMQAAAEKYQEAIDSGNVRMASLALNVIRRILETEPIRLNNLINVASKNLPLADLTATLREIMDALGAGQDRSDHSGEPPSAGVASANSPSLAAFENAHGSLQDLHALLRARVVEHDMWQEADNVLWSIERAFEMPAHDAIIEFSILWPEARASIASLADNAADAGWAEKIRRYAESLDDGLLQVEEQLGDEDDGDDEVSFKDGLRQSFDAFRREARYKFFSVDHQLKEDCAALVQISEPLETILQDLNDG